MPSTEPSSTPKKVGIITKISSALKAGKDLNGRISLERTMINMTDSSPERNQRLLKVDFDQLASELLTSLTKLSSDKNQPQTEELFQKEFEISALRCLFDKAARSLFAPSLFPIQTAVFFESIDPIGATFPVMSGETQKSPSISEEELNFAKRIFSEYTAIPTRKDFNYLVIINLPAVREYLSFARSNSAVLVDIIAKTTLLTGRDGSAYISAEENI